MSSSAILFQKSVPEKADPGTVDSSGFFALVVLDPDLADSLDLADSSDFFFLLFFDFDVFDMVKFYNLFSFHSKR